MSVVDTRAYKACGPSTSPDQFPCFVDRNGYRNLYTPGSSFEFGVVVIGSSDELANARRLAHKAHAALGLAYADLEYKPGFGFTLPRGACVESGYPCAPRARFMGDPLAYLSVEHSGAYENLDSKRFLVIAALGPPDSDLLSKTLTKARAAFPEAYQKTTRALWLVATQTKLPDGTSSP